MKFLSKIYLILTLDCEQSAKLTSDGMDRQLDWSERVASTLHRLICGESRRLTAQMNELNRMLEKTVAQDGHLPDLPEEARQRILRQIKR